MTLRYGGNARPDGTAEFRVWAPSAKRVRLQLAGGGTALEMQREQLAFDGSFAVEAPARAGDRYFYIVDDQKPDNKPVPDPVSRFLPEGVHGPTEIVDPSAFRWADSAWRGLPLRDYVLYELHVGTFTREGTFDAAIPRLAELKRLGVTVLELMPVAAFPGARDWGYDGVSPYAVQASYGGPDGLKRFVDAAHRLAVGVIQDVVYNHLGPEGNYLRMFGPYFTDRYETPWGEAINYDGDGAAGVRRYFVDNAAYWIREYHMDGLRLDAVHTIYDNSKQHVLAEITATVDALEQELQRTIITIAESDANDALLVRPRAQGGYGIDAVWSDDFHHAVHALFTGERRGYYQDFGRPEQIAQALNEGFVYQGEHFKFWGKPRGTKPEGMCGEQHILNLQNHDQVGNRAHGERLTALLPRGARKLAAALLLLAPQTPLLFMGQEYDEKNPFLFFTSFSDPVLHQAVAEGRRKEFAQFGFADTPDPEDPQSFERSKLSWQPGNEMWKWYQRLLELRREYVAHAERKCDTQVEGGLLTMRGAGLLVQAGLKAGTKLPPAAGKMLLESDEDGYAVRVLATDAG
ncbi:MAG: malto-oligosyltrehalose trehalohydrolase [Acidobacteriota bacterium]|nr:malto-oligosyltrehalose trehalohydrolase [Acidobacteriota bacterium]